MNLLTFLLQAQPVPGAEPTFFQQYSFLILMILIMVVMYFFMIRPQQKKQKEVIKWRDALKKGDKVVTAGGIYGTIVEVRDNVLFLEVDNNVKIKIDKTSVFRDITDTQATR